MCAFLSTRWTPSSGPSLAKGCWSCRADKAAERHRDGGLSQVSTQSDQSSFYRDQLELRRAEAVVVQLRAAAWIALAVVAQLTLATFVFGAPGQPIDHFTRAAGAGLGLVLLVVLEWPSVRSNPRPLSLLTALLFLSLPSLSAIFGGDLLGNATLTVVLGLIASALFPWGVPTQAALAATQFLLIGLSYFLVDPNVETGGAGYLNAIGGAILISVLIARRTIRVFEEGVRENLALSAAQERIRQLNEDLEATVKVRTEELDHALADQGSFSYAVSHDLRQPLRHIDGYLRLFEEKAEDHLKPDERDLLAMAHRALGRAGRMIDSLLQLSRLSDRTPRRRRVDLSAIAEDILNAFASADPKRSVACSVEPNLVVDADEQLVDVLLHNLLENAWKFTAKTANPRIEFGSEPSGVFFVRDNGTGFDMEHADKLFGTFQRLHALDEFAGEGIGLAAAQRIVRHHQGRIWAESSLDQGATFRFTLGA